MTSFGTVRVRELCAKSREVSVEMNTVSRQRESPPEIEDILKFDWCKIQILTWFSIFLAYLFIHEDGLAQYAKISGAFILSAELMLKFV